jgi:hypothetical protein
MGLFDGRTRWGLHMPYWMVIAGIYALVTIKDDGFSKMIIHQGNIKMFVIPMYKQEPIFLYIEGNNHPFQIVGENKEKIKPKLQKGDTIKFWTEKNKSIVRQAMINGEMVCPYVYNYRATLIFALSFIIIGGILIPIFIRERRKYATLYGDSDTNIKSKKEQARDVERLEAVRYALSHYNMDAKVCDFLKYKDSYRYNYYVVETNPLSKGRLCVRLDTKADFFSIELIYYSRLVEKTNDPSLNTVLEYHYRIYKNYIDIHRLQLKTYKFKYGSKELEKRLDGHYRYFMEHP